METSISPHISFNGNCREAFEFYHSVFGGRLTFNTFKEFHASDDPSEDNKIMHASLDVNDCFTLMGADTPNRMQYDQGKRVSVSLTGDNEVLLRGYFQQLTRGANITMPWDKAPWGDYFGMLTDQYGVDWMIDVVNPEAMRQRAEAHNQEHTM